jgi:hypothetical protein
MPGSIRSTLQYSLPQKNKKDYNELFISIWAHLFPINVNIHCYYAIKITEKLK